MLDTRGGGGGCDFPDGGSGAPEWGDSNSAPANGGAGGGGDAPAPGGDLDDVIPF